MVDFLLILKQFIMKGKTLLLTAIAGLTILFGCEKERDTITNAQINDGETIHMLYGESQQLHLNLTPKYVESLVEWKSSAADVVYVSPIGVITAKRVGEATITAYTTNDNFAPSIDVVVTAISTEKITIDAPSLELIVGESQKIKVTVSPDTASYTNSLLYTTTDASIAEVGQDGEVHAVSVGKCQIEVASPDGITAVCNVKVKPINVTDIKLKLSDEQGISLKKGENYTIEINVVPTNATNQKLAWTTSDAAVATVADGVVTGVAAGTATITVKSEDNDTISKIFTVTVAE